ncbi:FAD/NAD(P)-binding domain-containing protein [Ophiobolus disseminans]|uniref:FAD/NAD(P)-binding domain-containing protein n=1 Tax=Ophiobolus disseminans TaxID=1469910 RepID=A0A6A6ZIM0_9PLEO|nr:FAD/NAD(P)-binding domain-containing protein [Ophiobolus disseminans]
MPHAKRKADSASPEPLKRSRHEDAHQESLGKKRHIIIIVCLMTDLVLTAHHFQKYLASSYTFEVVEKNHGVGGTWLENTYPGCACDVPSDIYQYSFAPTKDWSTLYASSGEIQGYLSRVAKQFDLQKHIEFGTSVDRCTWHEDTHKWLVDTSSGGVLRTGRKADVLINAAGILNHYQYPDIPGLQDFKGVMMHTANWDHSVDLTGKKVGVIGAGASAIQNYFNTFFPVFIKDSSSQHNRRKELTASMSKCIKDEALRAKLIPKYEVGCRRLSPGEPFLKALQQPNVECIFDPIASCTSEGLQTQAGVKDIDVLIAATGFNTTFRPRFSLVGRDGVDMRDLWNNDPASYMGLGCAGFPNYLSMLGPNCPVANGSLIGEWCTSKIYPGYDWLMFNRES